MLEAFGAWNFETKDGKTDQFTVWTQPLWGFFVFNSVFFQILPGNPCPPADHWLRQEGSQGRWAAFSDTFLGLKASTASQLSFA